MKCSGSDNRDGMLPLPNWCALGDTRTQTKLVYHFSKDENDDLSGELSRKDGRLHEFRVGMTNPDQGQGCSLNMVRVLANSHKPG